MIRAKLIFIYTVLIVFVAVAIVGMLGAMGIVPISNLAIVSALLGPVIGIVATVANAKHIFDDPDAVTNIKREIADKEIDRKKNFADFELQRHQQESRTKNEYEAKIKHLEAEVSRWQRTALSKQNGPKITGIRPVPGSARTMPHKDE